MECPELAGIVDLLTMSRLGTANFHIMLFCWFGQENRFGYRINNYHRLICDSSKGSLWHQRGI